MIVADRLAHFQKYGVCKGSRCVYQNQALIFISSSFKPLTAWKPEIVKLLYYILVQEYLAFVGICP